MATHRRDVPARRAVPGSPDEAAAVADLPLVVMPGYRDDDAEATLNAAVSPIWRPRQYTVTQAAAEGFVDYDAIETVHVHVVEDTGRID